MTDTDPRMPGPGPLRAAAGAAELAQAITGLVGSDGCRLAGSGPLAPPARDTARAVTAWPLSARGDQDTEAGQ